MTFASRIAAVGLVALGLAGCESYSYEIIHVCDNGMKVYQDIPAHQHGHFVKSWKTEEGTKYWSREYIAIGLPDDQVCKIH